MGAVTLNNVSKSFGAVDVIKDVSLAIDEGEFCVLIGPSGSGKSTLLRIIAGLEQVTQGDVHIAGRRVTHLEAKQRDISMVFQSYALYPQMNVEENMSFALRLAKMPQAEIREKVLSVAQMLGLEHLLKRLPKELSGGQRQRVAMGRAIVRNPAVFLFDEPLSNLDAKLRAQVRSEIRDLHRRIGTTSVYVTHDQVEAMTMGQKVVVLRDGRIEQVGRPLDLYDRPANVFVAGFIGSPAINLLEARSSAARDGRSATLQGGTAIPLGRDCDVDPDREIILGVRPEHLEIVAESRNTIPARVVAIESTGSDTTVICDTPAGRICLSSKERSGLREGQTLSVAPLAGKALIFDAASQARLSPLPS